MSRPAWLLLMIAALTASWSIALPGAIAQTTAMPVEPITESASQADQAVLSAYADRLPHLREQIPAIVEAAEAAAEQVANHPETRIILPDFRRHGWFTDEYINRAGGLANASPRAQRRQTFREGDIVLVATDTWAQTDVEDLKADLAEYDEGGATVILFGSRAGMPDELTYDFFIDNGAETGDEAHRPTNVIATVTLGWMWTCEYGAALSRLGKAPGVLWTKAHAPGVPHNEPLQKHDGRTWLGTTDTPVEPEVLSHQYLNRVDKLIADLQAPAFQAQIDNAADVIARRMESGEKVWLSGTGHTVPHDINVRDGQAPWNYVYRSAMPRRRVMEQFDEGQLFVWIGYMGYVGLQRGNVDFIDLFEERGVEMIVSEAMPPGDDSEPPVVPGVFREDPEEGTVVATIDQFWGLPDAEVTVPWDPGFMAPVSGINSLLVYRMLDAEVADRLDDSEE